MPTPPQGRSSLGLSSFHLLELMQVRVLKHITHLSIWNAYITAEFEGSSLIPVNIRACAPKKVASSELLNRLVQISDTLNRGAVKCIVPN